MLKFPKIHFEVEFSLLLTPRVRGGLLDLAGSLGLTELLGLVGISWPGWVLLGLAGTSPSGWDFLAWLGLLGLNGTSWPGWDFLAWMGLLGLAWTSWHG